MPRGAVDGAASSQEPVSYLARLALAGLALGALELLLVAVTDHALFLSWNELTRFAGLALSAATVLTLGVGLLGAAALALLRRGLSPAQRPTLARRLWWSVMLASAPWLGLALWSLTAGRRVRDLPGRLPLVVLSALAAGAILATAARRVWLVQTVLSQRRAALALFAAVPFALLLDAHVLRRLYPVFHLVLSAFAVLCAAAAGARWPAFARRPPASMRRLGLGLGAASALGLCLSLISLGDAPNARFAVEQAAPLSGKLLALRAGADAPAAHAAPAPATSPEHALHARGLDLAGQDVLLITVDALRADRLRAYGGGGLTPQMDALAERSAVFLRAYTPTPHTSYALTSLLTGKFIAPVMELSEQPGDHPPLPRLLRRYGYRTAAFYPPAIFFVDEKRFSALQKDQLGFEYVKAMFAPAAQRVRQLDAYLRDVDEGHPVFAWVHLFEPHEPYEPPPGLARGDSPQERYDGEVRAVDRAVGELVTLFERRRGAENTIILTADHGEEFGDHGGHHHGTTLFDEQVRVPLLWSSPGAVARELETPIETIDITTTLLSAVGVPRDARMRGDDYSALLAGAVPPAPHHAFASIGPRRMVTDGRYKAICEAGVSCRLYDLETDPAERRDIARAHPEVIATLSAALWSFVASIPEVEAIALGGAADEEGGGWPSALARARLGDPAAKAELLPLLGSTRPEVRAAAARAVGELDVASASNILQRMRRTDEDSAVRAEAALSALRLGDAPAAEDVRRLLRDQQQPLELRRQAALVLAGRGEAAGAVLLASAAADVELPEGQRLDAIEALGALGPAVAPHALLPLLDDVRLRPAVARALGRIGGAAAVAALRRALARESYPQARRAEARALLRLGDKRAAARLIRRHLGSDTSLPDGVALLLQAGELARASGAGADLKSAASVRHGEWHCKDSGCRPLPGASIVLPRRRAPRGAARAVLRARAEGNSRSLRAAGQRLWLHAGDNELALPLPAGLPERLEVEADEAVYLQAIAVVSVPRPPSAQAPLTSSR